MSDPAIRLSEVAKMYKIFSSRRDNLVDALGMSRVLPLRESRYREFWALRGIDLTVERGARIGVIGRNGAGKSTLLKLITGALALTEGTLEVNGTIQALIDAGAGFHPEFTGYENIHAALTYQGFSRDDLAFAREDIEEFTESESSSTSRSRRTPWVCRPDWPSQPQPRSSPKSSSSMKCSARAMRTSSRSLSNA